MENEEHFLTECEFYNTERQVLFEKVSTFNVNFSNFNTSDQFIFLMQCQSPQILKWLGQYVYRRFNERHAHFMNCNSD